MEGKTVVITGANRGIGRETTRQCADLGARVIMACRDMTKCEEVRRFIVADTGNKQIYCKHCDLASQKSIRKFAEHINSTEARVDVLINNGGVMRTPNLKTAEGIELQLGVNEMGPFLLTNLLLDKLKASEPSRVVNLVSVAHAQGRINFDNLNYIPSYDKIGAYHQSQLAAMLFTLELHRRLRDTGVTCNAVYPGVCRTDLIRFMPIYSSFLASLVITPFRALACRTATEGARTVVFAATSKDMQAVSGEFVSDRDGVCISKAALDEEAAARLWAISANWTGLVEL